MSGAYALFWNSPVSGVHKVLADALMFNGPAKPPTNVVEFSIPRVIGSAVEVALFQEHFGYVDRRCSLYVVHVGTRDRFVLDQFVLGAIAQSAQAAGMTVLDTVEGYCLPLRPAMREAKFEEQLSA